MNRLWGTAALLGTIMLLSSCDELVHANFYSSRYKEDFHLNATLKPGGRLAVETMNGGVEVIGWEKDTVEITGTKSADTEEHLRQVKIDVSNSTPDTLRIRTLVPSEHRGGYGARYTIRVPARVNVDDITTSNGQVRLDGIHGLARVRTSNGSIRVNRLEGDLDAHTSNGKVEVAGLKGSANVRTSNGSVQLDEVRGLLDVSTSNGSITARLTDPEPQKPVRLETSNGSVNLTMEQFRDNPIRVRSSNASLTLHLPAATNAQLSASNSHAPITSDFMDIDLHDKHHLDGKLGTGGPTISLSTSNGSIKVLKN